MPNPQAASQTPQANPEHYDAIVIGSGQAGTPLCRALAEAGMRTALVEREHIGGTCVNEGCTPTKTMIASGRVAYLAHRGADYGVRTGTISIDMWKVRKRKRAIVKLFSSGSENRIQKTKGLDLIFGEAVFTDPKSVNVRLRNSRRTRSLTADQFFINAGCRPAIPSLPGLNDVPYLTSTSIMELSHGSEASPRSGRRLRRTRVRPAFSSPRQSRHRRAAQPTTIFARG